MKKRAKLTMYAVVYKPLANMIQAAESLKAVFSFGGWFLFFLTQKTQEAQEAQEVLLLRKKPL